MLRFPLWQPNITYGHMDAHGSCSWMIYLLKHCEFKRSGVAVLNYQKVSVKISGEIMKSIINDVSKDDVGSEILNS